MGEKGEEAMATLTENPARPFTFADLDEAPDDGRRWELIAGSLVVSPSPFGAHQWCVGRVYRLLDDASTSDTAVLPAPYDWRVEATEESFRPDVVVIRRTDFDPAGHLRSTPLLVAEVVSPGGGVPDHTLKRDRYEALGIPSYWIVDPAKPSLTELRLSGNGRYVEWATVTGEETFATDRPFGVEVTPAALSRSG
ncbi:MAG: Uma2 family endonuclease [Streptosporangiaceae bacterium]